jgi:ATP-dependent Lon protease
MPTERIPLFPLDVVLLPDAILPLHIFEPRYRELVRLCLDQGIEFGVVQQHEQGIAAVGCTAEVSQLLKKYDDGRMDILTIGRRPFRVHNVVEEKPYYEADVEFLDDQPGAPLDVQIKLLKKYDELHRILFGQAPPHLDADEVSSVAYSAAAELPLEAENKQRLLETRSEGERQRFLLERIEKWLPVAQHQQRIKKIAGGNGHGLQ